MKKTFLRSILILAALSAASGADFARTAQNTPESVAKAYFAALRSADWAKCASLMHRDELASMKRTFAAAINALSEREKIVVTLYYFEGLTLAEIGEILGVTESRVCQIHTKAVGVLRGQMTEFD